MHKNLLAHSLSKNSDQWSIVSSVQSLSPFLKAFFCPKLFHVVPIIIQFIYHTKKISGWNTSCLPCSLAVGNNNKLLMFYNHQNIRYICKDLKKSFLRVRSENFDFVVREKNLASRIKFFVFDGREKTFLWHCQLMWEEVYKTLKQNVEFRTLNTVG